jgi:hypothetical protein
MNKQQRPPGPPALPTCSYCGDDFLIPGRGYRHGCPKHDPAERAYTEEAIYEMALLGLAHLSDDEEIDVRDLMPHPERCPAGLVSRMTMGELRSRIRMARAAR